MCHDRVPTAWPPCGLADVGVLGMSTDTIFGRLTLRGSNGTAFCAAGMGSAAVGIMGDEGTTVGGKAGEA